MSSIAIGIDLGGTRIRGALVTRDGTILARTTMPTPATQGADAVVSAIATIVQHVAQEAGGASVLGVGLSAPGPLDPEKGLALATPTIAGFTNFPLRDRLQEKTGYRVVMEVDAIAACIGEWRFGAGVGLANLVYVTVSTGIGGGAVVDNRVLHGRKGMAAHVGHMTIVRGGELCACGNHGCFEAYASGTAFVSRARKLAVVYPGSILTSTSSAEEIFQAATQGDRLACELIDEEAAMLGIGFATLLHLYSPELIVIGGGMSNQFSLLQPGIMAAMQRCAMPPFRDVPVIPAKLGDNSGLAGAATLTFEALQT